MKRLSFVGVLAVLAVGCGGGEMDEGTHEHGQPHMGGEEVSAQATCISGYHLHEIDWNATAFSGDGACGHTRTMSNGEKFCMQDGSGGVSCPDGYWWVFGYRFDSSADGKEYGYVKIQALNGH